MLTPSQEQNHAQVRILETAIVLRMVTLADNYFKSDWRAQRKLAGEVYPRS